MLVTFPTTALGSTVIVLQLDVLGPQILLAVQQIVPEPIPKDTEMNLVPCPELIVASNGTDHVYVVPGPALGVE
jgi:hypothetical protein